MGLPVTSAGDLAQVARRLVASGKGLLAIDESNGTCDQRFTAAGIPPTPAMRRRWRELMITAPGLGSCISGVILYDETLRQSRDDGTSFVQCLTTAGILPGIKVDIGVQPLAGHPGEGVTEGLDHLRVRLLEYRDLGARFAKWRGVLNPAPPLPSPACLIANAHALARYAALSQEACLVPIVEPEVLMAGDHDLQRCAEVTRASLHCVFRELYEQGVALDSVILKTNMVLPGLAWTPQAEPDQVAEATLDCLREVVPGAIAGVAFLSGGQASILASIRLNAMHLRLRQRAEPWALTFSFARALQEPALALWGGDNGAIDIAQAALLHRARCNLAAGHGTYQREMDTP